MSAQPKQCPHHRVAGDNYGRTCQDCGQVLSGYGHFGQSLKPCLHHWARSADDPKTLECLYCQRTIQADFLD